MKRFVILLIVFLIVPAALAEKDKTVEVEKQEASADSQKAERRSGSSEAGQEEVEELRTPFGTLVRPKSRKPPEPEGEPSVWLFDFEEKGDSVTFKKKTPFGVTAWTKKKSELTSEERELLTDLRASKGGSSTSEKPKARERAPDDATAVPNKREP